jgi:hypothetical protein
VFYATWDEIGNGFVRRGVGIDGEHYIRGWRRLLVIVVESIAS